MRKLADIAPENVADNLEAHDVLLGRMPAVATRLYPDCRADITCYHAGIGVVELPRYRWARQSSMGRWWRISEWAFDDDPNMTIDILHAYQSAVIENGADVDKLVKTHWRGNGHITLYNDFGSVLSHVFCFTGEEHDRVFAAIDATNIAIQSGRI